MNRRIVVLICVLLTGFLRGVSAQAQQSVKIPRIGYLAPAKYEAREKAFRQGLRDLGYVEGQNIFIEWRIGTPNLDRLRELAKELVHLNVDIIVATSTFPVQATKDVTKSIPIVFAGVLDAEGSGFVESLARPGGNITGLSLLAPELNGKRLELLKEAFPKISRVAVLWNTEHPATARLFNETRTTSQALKVTLQSVEVQDSSDLDAAFAMVRPGGNITGLATLQRDLSGKRLELLAEIVPRLSRVGILRSANEAISTIGLKDYESAARDLNLQIHSLNVGADPNLEEAFQAALKARVGGLITITSNPLFGNSKRVTQLAIKHALPAMFEGSSWVHNGGLISYSANDIEVFHRAATYVDKILKGATPADLPIEQPTKFELVINLKTAKQIGLTVPQKVLVRADRVIK